MAATPLPVHPFPARMAPELALARIPRDGKERHVLDPMMGSGTIPVLAALQGHRATGFDLDPLAVVISTTWGRPLDPSNFEQTADAVAKEARRREGRANPNFDPETDAFVDRWFDPQARERLAALAEVIRERPRKIQTQLWCAFSRLIVTKDSGASLARDVSHSRPHRVRDISTLDPITEFPRSARDLIRRHRTVGPARPKAHQLDLGCADARQLPIEDSSVDLVMTSPPYLVAIDYLRGHRMSLVWMGYTLGALRDLRGTTIGSHRGLDGTGEDEELVTELLEIGAAPRTRRILRRYVRDLRGALAEAQRVTRPGGEIVLVVAEATLDGFPIDIAEIVERLASQLGLEPRTRLEREIPAARRYLPPPEHSKDNALARRMRTETCLGFAKS